MISPGPNYAWPQMQGGASYDNGLTTAFLQVAEATVLHNEAQLQESLEARCTAEEQVGVGWHGGVVVLCSVLRCTE